jgi:pimeloyl-ACP methyl ester carboxylesterase
VIPQSASDIAARYDLVGIDPRFFGRSTPLECGWPTGLFLHSRQVASPDRAAFDRGVATARDLAARCAGQREVLPHASTRNIARDMDVVRAALGERRVSYLGWSYGGYLGVVYLQMFPEHADRVVLDSAPDPGLYGPDLTRESGPADAAALRDWAGWAARFDGRYHRGETAEQVLSTVDDIDRAATRSPLRVGTHLVDAPMIPGLLLAAEDSDAAYAEFSAQVVVLRDAARGAVVAPTAEQEQKLNLLASQEVIAEFGFSATTANQCADRAASRDPESYYRDIRAHRATEPLYGPLERDVTACTFWPTDPAEPATEVRTDHPALIVGATGDSAAPYPGQQAMHRALTGSRMVTLDGAFRHGVYLFETNTCVEDRVIGYLLDGALPDADVTCARDPRR